MMNEKQIRKEIEKHEKLETYCITAGDSQEARKHRAYREAYTLVLAGN